MTTRGATLTLGLIMLLLVPAAARNGNTAWVSCCITTVKSPSYLTF